MKKQEITKIITTFLVLVSIFSIAVISIQPAKAQEQDLRDPGITPDNYLYGIDRAMESIHMSMTENRSERAELGLSIAEERLSEGVEMSYRGHSNMAEQMANQYRERLNESMNYSQELPERQREEIQKHVANQTTHHLEIMEEVRNKVPGHARHAVQEAINHTKRGRGMALGHLSEIAPHESAEMRHQYAQNLAYELQKLALDIEIEAETQENRTSIYLEVNDTERSMFLNTTNKQTVVEQIGQMTNLSIEEVNRYIEFKGEKDLEIEATITENETFVTIEDEEEEYSFSIEAVDRDQIVQEIVSSTNYSSSQVYRNLEVDDERDITLKWSIRDNQSIINLTIENQSFDFAIDSTSANEVIAAIQERTDLTTPTIKEKIREAVMTQERAVEYMNEMNMTTELMERASEMGINISSFQEKLANSTSRHLGALMQAYNKAPEPARNALVHAMNQSMRGQHMALEHIRERDKDKAQEIERGMPDWAQEMRSNWMNKSFHPGRGPGNHMPGMPGMQDREKGGPGMSGPQGSGDNEMGMPGKNDDRKKMGHGERRTDEPKKTRHN